MTGEAAFKAIADRMGYENINMVRPATITEAETVSETNITNVEAA